VFNLFFEFGFIFWLLQVKSRFFIRFMIETKILGQLNRVKLGQKFETWLVSHVFVNEFFWLNGVFGKHPLGIFWIVLFQNKM